MKHVNNTRARSVSIRFLLVPLVLGTASWSFAETPFMVAHFIDVGQADATLVEFPCGVAMIDAGAQDQEHADTLVEYLDQFFARRTDLNRTIDVLFVTHSHIDHNKALRKVVEGFNVKRYVDNGMAVGKGKPAAEWIHNAISGGALAISSRDVCDEDVIQAGKTGLTDGVIDPIKCGTCDPKIAVLSGRMDENPGWADGTFENQNNQSLVVRVDFGEASFLFSGDLEEDALDTLADYYVNQADSPESLDVDVYHVGHHGSHNGVTKDIVDAMTPKIAVISMGVWDDGKDPFRKFSTWAYGHPREGSVKLVQSGIKRYRSQPVEVHVFEGAKKPKSMTIRKAVYATGWDGTVDIRATTDGKYTVTTSNN